ncbi:uncharacterized protein LOC144440239 isoform X2 [Glandiceps talaboti]
MMCIQNYAVETNSKVQIQPIMTTKVRETDGRYSDIPPDILQALDEEVAMLTAQMSDFAGESLEALTSGSTHTDGNLWKDDMNFERSNGFCYLNIDDRHDILRDMGMPELTGHERHFNIDLEVAEITGAFKPNGYRLGNMAARFKSGYLIDNDDGFDSSLPFRHFRNRYGNSTSLINTPVAKGFFPIRENTPLTGESRDTDNITSPSILKPKATKILSPLPVSTRDKMAVDKILEATTVPDLMLSALQKSTIPRHLTHGSDHDSGRSSGQSSEEKTSLDEEPFSISDNTKSPPKIIRKQSRQKRTSKGQRKDNLARFFKSFKGSPKLGGKDKEKGESGTEMYELDEGEVEECASHVVPTSLPRGIIIDDDMKQPDSTPNTKVKKVTFDLPAFGSQRYDHYESDGFFSDEEDDDDDDSSSWTGSTSSFSSWSSCSTCCSSCCSCSSCSTCFSDLTMTTTQSEWEDVELFFTDDDYLIDDDDTTGNLSRPCNTKRSFLRGQNSALNDLLNKNDFSVTLATSLMPLPRVKKEIETSMPPTLEQSQEVSTVYL